jgi:AraC-like DNA-binding protein
MTAMKSPVTTATISWLTSGDSAPLILAEGHVGYSRTQIPLSPEIGSGWVEMFPLALGMSVARGFHHFEPVMIGQIVPFFDVTGELTEPTLSISVARTGRVILKQRCVGIDFIFGQGQSLFEHVDRLDYVPTLDASCDIEVTMLKIGDSMLATLLGETAAHTMLKALHVADVPSAAVKAVPPHISASLYESMPAHLTGMMRKLHAQAKALEYICALAGHLAVEEARIPPESAKKKQVQQLYEELSGLQGKVPTLDDLARQYGMSARVLNEEFRKVYGVSIFSYISELRLKEAHEALLKTDLPMKSMALNMGYSHVNHFISAFGKKFGYSPGSLRKRK